MLAWAMTFLAISLTAAALGFGGVAGASAGIAQMLFVVFLVPFLRAIILRALRSSAPQQEPPSNRNGAAAAPVPSCGPDRPGKSLQICARVAAKGIRLFPDAGTPNAKLSDVPRAQKAPGRSTGKVAGLVRRKIRAESPRRRAPGHRSGSGRTRQADWQRPRPAGFPCSAG